jgi:hypothetical protein
MLKQLALVLLLSAVFSGSAAAEWTLIGPSGGSEAKYFVTYADYATIRKTGNKVKMWVLFNYPTAQSAPQGKTYLSQKSHEEYDCKEETERTLYLVFLSGPMGTGDPISTTDSLGVKPSPVVPRSVGEAL